MSLSSPSPSAPWFAAYRELPRICGPSFLPVSFLGRLPTTMAPVAILTFAASSTGSLAAAGLATTATAAGTALGAPLMGWLADRRGQRAVLGVAVPVNALALLGLAGAPAWPLFLALCALVGLSMPQVGGMARARWLVMTRGRTGTAFAVEGTNDEAAYVLGPALAGVLAAGWGARSALLAAAVAALVAAGAFALHPTHQHGRRQPGSAGAVTAPGGVVALCSAILGPALSMMLMGAFFAAVQCALAGYAATIGRPTAGGLIYALMAVGSAATALASAGLPARIGPRLRCAVAAAGLALGVLAMARSAGTGMLCAAVLVTGLAVGPLLVTLNQVAGGGAAPELAATAMALLSAAVVVGVAAGALSAGPLADAHGPAGAFAVAGSAAVLLLALSRLLPAR